MHNKFSKRRGEKIRVLNRFQVAKMKDLVHEADPQAYITIRKVADVFAANQK